MLALAGCAQQGQSLSPLLAIVKLYVSDGSGVTARRASDGGTLWSFQKGRAGQTFTAGDLAFTTVGGGGLGDQRMVDALRAGDGSLVWSYTTTGSVVAAGNAIVCVGSFDRQNPSHVTALNATDGSVRWSYQLEGAYRPNATIVGNVVYVYGAGGSGASSASDFLYALQVTDGKLLWKTKTSFSDSPVPAVADGVVYVADLDGYVNAVRASDGNLLWRVATGTNGARSTLATGPGAVYASSDQGYVVALNAVDGATLWRHALDPANSPMAADGVVYVNTRDGYLVALNAPDGKLKWSFQVSGLPDDFSTPLVRDGAVFSGVEVSSTSSSVYAVSASNGASAWRIDTSPSLGPPILGI